MDRPEPLRSSAAGRLRESVARLASASRWLEEEAGRLARLAEDLGPLGPQTLPGASPPPAGRVLVVEDQPEAARSLRDLLLLRGHEVRLAATGADGLQALDEFQPDLLFCNLGLPDMTGHDLALRVRLRRGRAPKVVAMSAWPLAAGRTSEVFDARLDKPIAPDLLGRLLDRLVQAC